MLDTDEDEMEMGWSRLVGCDGLMTSLCNFLDGLESLMCKR